MKTAQRNPWVNILSSILAGSLSYLLCGYVFRSLEILEGGSYVVNIYSFIVGGTAAILLFNSFAKEYDQKPYWLIPSTLAIGVLGVSIVLFVFETKLRPKNISVPAIQSAESELYNFDLINEFSKQNNLSEAIKCFTILGDRKTILYTSPPFSASIQMQASLNARLRFSIALAPATWQPGKGDGAQFDIYLDDGNSRLNLFSKYIDPKNIPSARKWHDQEIDLSPWAGQTIALTFATSCGPNDNCNFDWAGWGEPRIVQPIAYNFWEHFSASQFLDLGNGKTYTETMTINDEARPIIFQLPTSRLVYTLDLPQHSTLAFGFGMAPEIWYADKGDGVEFNIYVRKPEEPYKLYLVYQKYIDPKNNPDDRHWFDGCLDLSRFGNQVVEIIFETLPGPAGNSNYDWAGLSTPALVSNAFCPIISH